MTVITYEKNERGEACREMLLASEIISDYKMLTILPIPFTRDGVNLSSGDISVSELCSGEFEGGLVVGYGIPVEVKARLSRLGAVVVDCEGDERFLLENAYLTALATVRVILNDGARSPEELGIGIVGYGRIGRSLARMLLSLGASPVVYTSREDVAICLGESGVSCERVSDIREISGLDYLINTSPSPYLLECEIDMGVRILELCPGKNFSGGTVQRLPALPARYFPVTAGHRWAQSALRLLSEVKR